MTEDNAYLRLPDIDHMAPFLINVVSNGDVWIFAGSNAALTAGRRNPDRALFPYQTADKLLEQPQSAGMMSCWWAERPGREERWEPFRTDPTPAGCRRALAKHVCGTSLVFEETNELLGLYLTQQLEASDEFGLVRICRLTNIGAEPVRLRGLDGWHHLLPPGVSQETYARYSYLAAAYMRHELLADVGLGLYTMNSALTDRAEPAESLRVSVAWSLGPGGAPRLLCDRQVGAFRRGDTVAGETEIRGAFGAYLLADSFELAPGESREWLTVADQGLDHRAVLALRAALRQPEALRARVLASLAENTAGIRRRVAAADGLQQTADQAVCVHHFSNTLFNLMRGGALVDGYRCARDDVGEFLKTHNLQVADRHAAWLAALPESLGLEPLRAAAEATGDAQLARLARVYLPLCFSRRHGDPSRPWNQFDITMRDADGRPRLGYSGNWRDLFQNWEALAQSHPACLDSMIAVFLNASTADGYNPYRITRDGIDWEVHNPADPWSHIGYWGDHQLIYLLRLLESQERFQPGQLAAALDRPAYASAQVPYRIAGFEAMVADAKHTIAFDQEQHTRLLARAAELGADGRLIAGADGLPRLVSLAEKLLVPALAKLSNLVPGGGIWLNTQRPEWNDANNALAGWGLSVVTVGHLRRYLVFLDRLLDAGSVDVLTLSAPVAGLVSALTSVLADLPEALDDEQRFAAMAALGRAGEAHRAAVYGGAEPALVAVGVDQARALIAAALPVVEATLRSNLRTDGLAHSYNLLALGERSAGVRHLYTMLEGQVSMLSSGLLNDAEVLALLDALAASDLYRPDQNSYLLYPDRAVAPFLARNTLPDDWREQAPALAALVDGGATGIVVLDGEGGAHFQADLTNTSDLAPRLAALPAADRAEVRALWEQVFTHSAFTGRSGTMFGFEGLGSIYWHMVAKLLLAVQECHGRAADGPARQRLAAAYHRVRDGLGFRKSPAAYGAFPADAYSHTPAHAGAQQPGMTGQVKEEILTRLGELGVSVADGCLNFAPCLLAPAEFTAASGEFAYVDVMGAEQTLLVPTDGLAFTVCGVPVVYRLGSSARMWIELHDGQCVELPGGSLSAELSQEVFARSGRVRACWVEVVL